MMDCDVHRTDKRPMDGKRVIGQGHPIFSSANQIILQFAMVSSSEHEGLTALTCIGGVRKYRFNVSVTEDSLVILLLDTVSKTQWESRTLAVSDFEASRIAIPRATLKDYATIIASCLDMLDSCSWSKLVQGPSLTNDTRDLHLGFTLVAGPLATECEHSFTLRAVGADDTNCVKPRLQTRLSTDFNSNNPATSEVQQVKAKFEELVATQKTVIDQLSTVTTRLSAIEEWKSQQQSMPLTNRLVSVSFSVLELGYEDGKWRYQLTSLRHVELMADAPVEELVHAIKDKVKLRDARCCLARVNGTWVEYDRTSRWTREQLEDFVKIGTVGSVASYLGECVLKSTQLHIVVYEDVDLNEAIKRCRARTNVTVNYGVLQWNAKSGTAHITSTFSIETTLATPISLIKPNAANSDVSSLRVGRLKNKTWLPFDSTHEISWETFRSLCPLTRFGYVHDLFGDGTRGSHDVELHVVVSHTKDAPEMLQQYRVATNVVVNCAQLGTSFTENGRSLYLIDRVVTLTIPLATSVTALKSLLKTKLGQEKLAVFLASTNGLWRLRTTDNRVMYEQFRQFPVVNYEGTLNLRPDGSNCKFLFECLGDDLESSANDVHMIFHYTR